MGFGINWWARASEKMVADWMARWRGGETIKERRSGNSGAGWRHTLEYRGGLHIERRMSAGRRITKWQENP